MTPQEKKKQQLVAWRGANPEKVRAQRKRQYEKRKLKPEHAQYMAAYRQTDAYKQANRARAAAWREQNPEAHRQQLQRWKKTNRPKVNADWHKYNASKTLRRPPWFNEAEVKDMYLLAEILSRGGVTFEVDHIVPLRGETVSGLHVTANLQVIPAYVNREKSNKFTNAE
jgi:hypothetical protein